MQRKVLIVDDDPDLRQGLRVLLEQEGIEVAEAGAIGEAKQALNRSRPHLLVVDGMLPDGNGIEWISMLRAEGEPIPVVFMSHYLAKGGWLKVLSKLGVRHRINKRETPVEQIAEVIANATPLTIGKPGPPPAPEPEVKRARRWFGRGKR